MWLLWLLFTAGTFADDEALPGLALDAPPDFSVPGHAEVIVRNAGATPTRLLGVDLVGPVAGGLREAVYLAPGAEVALPLAWGRVGSVRPQLLLRTSEGTVILPGTAPVTLVSGGTPTQGLVGVIAAPVAAEATTPQPAAPSPSAGLATPSAPIILGALAKDLIDAEIKDHMAEVRRCYQRGLARDFMLEGKLIVKFVIAKDGAVSSAQVKGTTLPHGSVEACVVDRFAKLRFPDPKGGGIVIVAYPFIFSPS